MKNENPEPQRIKNQKNAKNYILFGGPLRKFPRMILGVRVFLRYILFGGPRYGKGGKNALFPRVLHFLNFCQIVKIEHFSFKKTRFFIDFYPVVFPNRGG
jgi:hypothetical protein